MAATPRGSDDSFMISQPRLFDFIANSPAMRGNVTQHNDSPTRSNSGMPEREPDRVSNRQRKADKKRQ